MKQKNKIMVLKRDIVFKAGTVVHTGVERSDHNGPMALVNKAMGRNATMTLILPLEDCQPARYIAEKGARS